jgi:hypothetical protein
VKFQAAQALAYLGEKDGVEILKEAAAGESEHRWHALTALASLDHSSAGEALASLLHGTSAEARYGAFRALSTRSAADPIAHGQFLGKSFYLHEIKSDTTDPMIHFSRSKKPEIVVFGTDQTVDKTFLHVKNGLTVKAIGNDRVLITRFETSGVDKKTCSNKVNELIRTMAQMGYDYGTIVRMFREAMQNDQLNTRMVVNAVPKIRRDRKNKEEALADNNKEKSKSVLPDLFRPTDTTEKKKRRVTANNSESNKEKPDNQDSTFTKFRNWFTPKPQSP